MSRLLHSWVTEQAQKQPDAPAITLKNETLTYTQLDKRSSRIAALLMQHGCQKGDRVGLLMNKDITAICAIIGVLKAGGAYVPLDPSSPASRLEHMLLSAEPPIILAAGKVDKIVSEIYASGKSSAGIGLLDEAADKVESDKVMFRSADVASALEKISAEVTPEDLAYILFTSGSTGVPKGVAITHSNVAHFVEWAVDYFGMDASDKTSGFFPLHFDLSVFDIFCSFAAGAHLHIVPAEATLLPNKLAAFMRDSELTQWFSVPSILNYMAKFDVVKQDDMPKLKRLLWCGEVFPTPPLIYWMKKLPHVAFTNLYGPTEATIASSYYTLPRVPAAETDPVPIGIPCAGEELVIMNGDLKEVPRGETGDLYIKGVGLSPGYWRDKDKTAAAFLTDPQTGERIYKTGDLAYLGDDNLIYFLGRADSQIKSRGYRIELGEIETALNALRDLREVAVVAVDSGGFEGATICCAYAAVDSKDVEPKQVRKELQKNLPSYMIPTEWMVLDVLPKNVNGKIDRKNLRQQFEKKLES